MLLDNAQDLVAKNHSERRPKPSANRRCCAESTARSNSAGAKFKTPAVTREDIDLIRNAFEAGKIKTRFVNAVYGPGEDAQNFLREGPIINAFDHHFTQRTIKVIFDGALGSRGAALLEAVQRRARNLRFSQGETEDLRPMFEEALRRGIQVETHAIGDRANRLILDLYEQAFKAVPPDERKIREPRWRIEHAQILDPARYSRASPNSASFPQCSHRMRSAICFSLRLGLGWIVSSARMPGKACSRAAQSLRRFRRASRTWRTDDRILRRRRAQKHQGRVRRRLASRASRLA